MENLLIRSENLKGLNFLLDNQKLRGMFDLVYIDPPFATNDTFKVTENRKSTISRSMAGEVVYTDKILGKDYLDFLRPRLMLIKELLSEAGSIYLHIDYKIGHHVKILMDDIFGIRNFRNDITRIKCNPKNFKRIGYGNIKDLILFYSKSSNPIWHEPHIPYTNNDLKRLFPKVAPDGRRYTTVPLHAPGETANGKTNKLFKGIEPPIGRHWRTDVETLEEWDRQGIIEWSTTGNPRKKIYADQRIGKRLQDVWDYKDPQYPHFPTEKSIDLLKMIISTSSDPKSYVLDCFCGSGTTLVAAQELGRSWVGIDSSRIAIDTAIGRLSKSSDEQEYRQNFQYYHLLGEDDE